MKNKNLHFELPTDKELLRHSIFYLSSLRALLPSACLQDHCSGAIASLFELYFYLCLNNLKDYGDNKK